MKLVEIAKEIANKAGMPYAWEDVLNRLKNGVALPFKLEECKYCQGTGEVAAPNGWGICCCVHNNRKSA